MRESGGRAVSVITGAAAGALLTAVAAALLSEAAPWLVYVAMPTLTSGLGGTLSGALCGFLAWALSRPRQRIVKSAAVLASLNCAAWLLFLFAHRSPEGIGVSIRDQRAQIDLDTTLGWPNGMTLVSHPPTLLAGRVNTWVPLSEKPLGLFAGPAVVFVHEQIVPARYGQTGATVSESYWIAGLGFVISTAWWVSAGSLLHRFRRRQT